VNGHGNGNGSGNGQGGPSGKRILLVGGAVLLGIAVVNNAYRAGLSAGLIGSGRIDGEYAVDGWGLIPFPPFPLIFIGFLAFLAYRRGVFGGPRRGGPGINGQHGGHPGPGPERGFGGQPPRVIAEWHRRLHEAERTPVANGGRVDGNGGAYTPPQAPTSAPSAGTNPAEPFSPSAPNGGGAAPIV